MNETFFTSDTHFGHTNIISYCSRPFDSVEEMTEKLIDNWNAKVGRSDKVYHLGDFAFLPKFQKSQVLNSLNGQKFLIRGNHDEGTDSLGGWSYVYEYKELRIDKHHLVLAHYPMLTWNGAHKGWWQLHGHCHGGVNHLNESTTRLDVGVDSHNYEPLSFQEVASILSKRSYQVIDHHGE